MLVSGGYNVYIHDKEGGKRDEGLFSGALPLRQQQTATVPTSSAPKTKSPRCTTRHLEKAGITRGQYALLANIERNPGISVSALAETMDLERTTLVRNLKPLEARGLIVDAACKAAAAVFSSAWRERKPLPGPASTGSRRRTSWKPFLGQEQIAELNHLISAILELN